MKRLLASLAVVAVISGCAFNKGDDSSVEEITAAAYRSPEQPSLTIFTMVNNRTGGGGHTGLMVNASQRVIFDPAGSFRDDRIVERGDVLYGISPAWLRAYKSAHSRSTFHVVSQEIPVTAAQAEQALRLVQANGQVPGAFCANSTTAILSKIDGFPEISSTFSPIKLMTQVALLPNVTTTKLFEDDADNLVGAVREAAQTQ